MKNIMNTTKYIFGTAVIAVAAFLVAAPSAFAQDVPGYDIPGYDIPGYDVPGYDVPSYGAPTIPGYDIPGYDIPTYSGSPVVYNPVDTNPYNPPTVISGGTQTVYSAPTYVYGGYGGYYGGVVTSGGAFGGTPAQPVIYQPSGPITVSSGGSSGGTPAQPVTYNYSGPATVVSGGTNYYYPVQTSTYVPNQVLAYTDTRNPNLSSVYLSDVPYTGAGDVLRVIGFILALALWSFAITFYFMKRKANLELVPAVKAVWNKVVRTKTNESQAVIFTGADSDLEILETYARAQKVLLSTDAAKKLIKLERLNKADAKKVVRNAAGNDWAALGEKDIEKYL
jgi:hypothetical protein